MQSGEVFTLMIASLIALAVGGYFERRLWRRKRVPRFLLPIRSQILRVMIALAVGGLAAYLVQPWRPGGWPWWKAALFIGFSSFAMWGSMSLRYWAYRKVQRQDSDHTSSG